MRAYQTPDTARDVGGAVRGEGMPDQVVSAQAYLGLLFACTVLGTSVLAGMAFGALLCFRRRRTAMLGLAATCAGVALIVVLTETAEGSPISHALEVAAGLASLPIVAAVVAFILVGIARSLWAIARRTLNAIWSFGSNILADCLRIVTNPSGQERESRTLSKASRLTLRYLAFAEILVVALNIGAIADLATQVAPRLSIVTNVLDLISLILITPKLFTIETRDNVRGISMQTLRSFTLNKIVIPPNHVTYIIGAAMFVSLFSLFPLVMKYLLDYQRSQLLEISNILKHTFPTPFPFLDYFSRHVIEVQEVSTKMWVFEGPVMIVTVVLATSVILLSALAKASPEAQEKLSDKLLFLGIVVFAYSRALSMMG